MFNFNPAKVFMGDAGEYVSRLFNCRTGRDGGRNHESMERGAGGGG